MAAPLDRSWYNTLVDDDGSGQTGTVWDKSQVNALMNTIDSAFVSHVDRTGTPALGQIAVFTDADTLRGDALLTPPNGQIKFPTTQVASSDPYTLDDYREQPWTPTILATGSASGQTYSKQQGTYTKIGRRITASFWVALSAKGTLTGDIAIGGFPYPPGPSESAIAAVLYILMATTWSSMIGFVDNQNQNIFLRGTTGPATNNNTPLQGTDIANTTNFIGTISFLTAN